MPTHVDLLSCTSASGQVSGSKTYTAEGEEVFDIAVPAPSTNMQVDLAIDVSTVKSIILHSDRDMTLKFNNSTTPVPEIALKAGVPYIWNTDAYNTLLLTADVTVLFLTLAAGVAATLKIRCLVDPTP